MAAELRDGEVQRSWIWSRSTAPRTSPSAASAPGATASGYPASRRRRAPGGHLPAPVDRPVARRPATARAHLGLLRRRLPQAGRGRRRLPGLQRHQALGPRPRLAAPRGGGAYLGTFEGGRYRPQDDSRRAGRRGRPGNIRRSRGAARLGWGAGRPRGSAGRLASCLARAVRGRAVPAPGAARRERAFSAASRVALPSFPSLRHHSAPSAQPRDVRASALLPRCHESMPDPIPTYSRRFGGSTHAVIQVQIASYAARRGSARRARRRGGRPRRRRR